MLPINIKLLCNNPDNDSFRKYEKIFSQRDTDTQIRDHEISCLKTLVGCLNLPVESWEGFYYSYSIPQIGKEFDLLRVCEGCVLNIELKSERIPIEEIEKQLLRNKYYLHHMREQTHIYSCIANNGEIQEVYWLDGEVLKTIDASTLGRVIVESLPSYMDDLNKLFKPSTYLVSPINNPERFIGRRYFLTHQQEEIKEKVLGMIDLRRHAHPILNGKAGSGKTLLIYDIAKRIANSGKIAVIIHVGIKDAGHFELERLIPNFKVIAIKNWHEIEDIDFEVIFIDESQRLMGYQLKGINKVCKERNKVCMFCLDPQQLLNRGEVRAGVAKFLSIQRNSFALTEKIRTNKELASFVKALFNLPKDASSVKYRNIHVEFARTEDEVRRLLCYFKDKGYEYISHTPSRLVSHNTLDSFSSPRTSHKVIGQEFDKVVVIVDNDFYYTERGELTGVQHPCPDYMYRGLLFQELTRARDEVCIIVYNNESLYKKIISILNNETFAFEDVTADTEESPSSIVEQLSFE